MGEVRVRRVPSIYRVHYGLRPAPVDMPRPLQALGVFSRQVAGHKHSARDDYQGILQSDNGTILKPILKESQRREIDFYDRLYSSDEPDLIELRNFVPNYLGFKKYTYNGREREYIILEDVTRGILEPCIMDVKIGKQTWDPLASEEKRVKEQSKYSACKQQYGFCIPGYQVCRTGGRITKYDKEHGKKLHGKMVEDAIRNFVSLCGGGLCRGMLVQLAAALWRVQRWACAPRRLRLYAASLLVLYDATALHTCRHTHKPRKQGVAARRQLPRRHSVSGLAGSNFSGQLSPSGPLYPKVNSVPLTCMTLHNKTFSAPPPIHSPWSEALQRLDLNHSFEHNYDEKLSKIKVNYHALLDQLANDGLPHKPWATVKIIDFAHAFFNDEEEPSVDENFKEGIDNFIAIIENLLKETDDQIF